MSIEVAYASSMVAKKLTVSSMSQLVLEKYTALENYSSWCHFPLGVMQATSRGRPATMESLEAKSA